jgi:isoleucyl-tRNA synthetase
VRVLAPVLSFTAEEVWEFAPESLRDADSVHLSDWPTLELPAEAAHVREAYAVVLEVRETVTRALEIARNDKVVGKSQEAAVTVTVPTGTHAVLEARGAAALAEMFIVAHVDLVEGVEISAAVVPASGEKCPRCWNHRELTADGVCARCADVLKAL